MMGTENGFIVELLRRELIRAEGIKLTAYVDTSGYLHIGHGICIDDRVKGAGITPHEAAYLLQNRMAVAMTVLSRNAHRLLHCSDIRKTVIVCMAYQLGVAGVEAFEKMFAALEKGDFATAADEMLDSVWAKQTPERAARMAQIMASGVFPVQGI